MNNYLTVPAAPPDSPTMCRARLASGKHIYLRHNQMQTLDSYLHYTERYHVKQWEKIHHVIDGTHRDQTLYFVRLTRRLSQNDKDL